MRVADRGTWRDLVARGTSRWEAAGVGERGMDVLVMWRLRSPRAKVGGGRSSNTVFFLMPPTPYFTRVFPSFCRSCGSWSILQMEIFFFKP